MSKIRCRRVEGRPGDPLVTIVPWGFTCDRIEKTTTFIDRPSYQSGKLIEHGEDNETVEFAQTIVRIAYEVCSPVRNCKDGKSYIKL